MLSDLLFRLRSIFLRKTVEGELDDELRFHFERQVEKYVKSGLTREEAMRRARLEFGGRDQIKEECRDARGVHFLETLAQDIRYGFRQLHRSSGFTGVVVLTLALGIGANTAIFSAVNGILLQPLPYADSSRLVKIESFTKPYSNIPQGVSFPAIQDIQTQCSAFERVAVFMVHSVATMQSGFASDIVNFYEISSDSFSMLGVRPLLGRTILPADMQPGNERVVVLGYDLWERDFGKDPSVVGRQITLDDRPYTVIGVMPPEFTLGVYGDLWRPLLPNPKYVTSRSMRVSFVVARLKKNATLKEANAQLSTLAARLAASYPGTEKGWELSAKSVKENVVSQVRAGLLVLLGAVGLVLLIACVNISALLLSRGWARQKEVAIREALGATKLRILRQFLVEGMLLALVGGAAGLLVSIWAIRLIRLIAPSNTPRVEHVNLDPTVLLFTLGISLLAGILFTLAPAIQVSTGWMGTALKNLKGSTSGFSAKKPLRLRRVLVTIEVALAMVLVLGAVLLARSFERLITINLGYRADHMLTAYIEASKSSCDYKNPSSCEAVMRNILDRLRNLPGVDAAAIASGSPLVEGATSDLYVERPNAQVENISNGVTHSFKTVTPDYFLTLKIQFLAGRDFSDTDTNNSTHVAIVDQSFARQYFSGNPLGKRISMEKDKDGQPKWMEIIGEVGDSRGGNIREKPAPQFYTPFTQDSYPFMAGALLVRTAANPMAMAAAIREQIWAVDKNAPIVNMQTMDEAIAYQTAQPKFQTLLLGSFGALGLVLAIVGLFGVISYSVVQRTHEIGVRMALGAEPGDVLRMVAREGMLLAAAGIVIGVCGALALGRVLQSFLYEIKPTDPATFISVAITLGFVALVACIVPARRAMKVDPIVALRYE